MTRTPQHHAVTRRPAHHGSPVSHKRAVHIVRHAAAALRPHAVAKSRPRTKPAPAYRSVVKATLGRVHPVIVQLPTSGTAPTTRSSSSGFGPQTVARVVSSALQSLGKLVQTGGGGFGRRIVQQFPLTLFLLGIAAMVLGSALSASRYVRRAEAG
jgi:hypothetical protein